MVEWISRQHTILVAAQEHQLQSDQHKVVENDPDITTGVIPAELILNSSLRLTKRISTEPSTMDRARLNSMSGQLDSWISRSRKSNSY